MRSNLISVKAMDAYYKHPRLYVDQSLEAGKAAVLSEAQAHYLKNVLRRAAGDSVRVFNARDGEFAAAVEALDKRGGIVRCGGRLRAPRAPQRRLHLVFPPLAKDRMDFLIEKSVELGATDLHPVTTRQCDIRKINAERLAAQIIEAAEQCERLDIARLHPLQPLEELMRQWDTATPLFAAVERSDAAPLRPVGGDCALLVGPPGGFSDEEKEKLANHAAIRPVTLTDTILRTETAAIYGLSVIGTG